MVDITMTADIALRRLLWIIRMAGAKMKKLLYTPKHHKLSRHQARDSYEDEGWRERLACGRTHRTASRRPAPQMTGVAKT